MGPRSIDRGILKLRSAVNSTAQASMGPRSIDRGIGFSERLFGRTVSASMGPRSIDRGIGFDGGEERGMNTLQWGRDRSIAELWRLIRERSRQAASMGPRSID